MVDVYEESNGHTFRCLINIYCIWHAFLHHLDCKLRGTILVRDFTDVPTSLVDATEAPVKTTGLVSNLQKATH